MFKRVVFGLGLVVLLAGIISPLLASDQTFPVGLWLSDSIFSLKGLKPEWLAALRWQGINIGTAGGEVNTRRECQYKLARYDSVGYRIWLAVGPFHSSGRNPLYPGDPNHQYLDISGRDPIAPETLRYFISHSLSDSTPAKYFLPSLFDTYLDSVVASVVDSVKNAHALWKYFYWDEPNNSHYNQASHQWTQYWHNIWWGPDATCSSSDSLGVHSWLKWKIEHRDLVHSVCINLGDRYGNRRNAAISLCNAKYQNLQGDTFSNRMQSVSYDNWPFLWSTPIGDPNALRNAWTDIADTMVAIAKRTNPLDPVPVYDTQLQHCGTKNADPAGARITTPEEVRELANLTILHEVKGLFYFVLPSDASSGGWAEFWDENYVPFDAPYEDYVYQRMSSFYYPPNGLRPFDNFDPIHDPFHLLTLPPPDSTQGQRGKENYYLWKYAPYARNWDFLRTINDPIHINAPHLRNIWKVGQRITSVVADGGVPTYVEYVTFADSVKDQPPTAFYAFIVSKDFNSPQRSYTVTVNGNGLPHPPSGQRYYVLDLNSRHLIPSTGNIVFHTVLKPGEGRLFRFIIGPQPSGGGSMGAPLAPLVPNPYNGSMWSTLLVTDPDVSFYKSGQQPLQVQFTEGDTVVLSAVVYNLGFSAKSDTVKFYIGDPLSGGTFLGKSYVTVPALNPDDTLPKYVTVTYNWVTTSSSPLGPYDINVFLNGASSSAHSLLWLNAEDYATKVNSSPWDMTETKPNQDIVSSPGFTNLTDSISGVWEGTTYTMPPPPPALHFRLASSIDASKYKMLQFRIFSSDSDSCTVRWSPQQPGGLPGMTILRTAKWQVVTINLGAFLSWGGSVTDFYLQFPQVADKKIRLAWTKLTTR